MSNKVTIIRENNFSFSYIWSGEVYGVLGKNPNLNYTLLDKYSHIEKDLISITNKRDPAICVHRPF